ENIFDLAEQSPPLWAIFHLRHALEFLQKFALTLGQLARRLHSDIDEKITFAMAIKHGHTLVSNTEGGARLSAFRNLQDVLAVHRGHLDLGTQRSLRKRNGNNAAEVGPFSLEEGMLFNVKDNVEVSRGSTEISCFSHSRVTDSGAIFHPSGNVDLHLLLRQSTAFPFALGARISNHRTSTLAGRACTSDTEEPLLISHLPATAAGSTCYRSLPGSCSGPLALLTLFVATDRDLAFRAKNCFIKLQRQILPEVSSTLGTATPATSASSEQITKTEKVAKNVAEILEYARIETRCSGSASHPSMTKAVIAGTFLLVSENRISLATFLEFFFGIRIVRIAVGVILHRKLTVSALDFNLGGRLGNTEYFVVIAFCISVQSQPFLRQFPSRGLRH